MQTGFIPTDKGLFHLSQCKRVIKDGSPAEVLLSSAALSATYQKMYK